MKKIYIVLGLTLFYSCACPSIIKEYNSECEKASIVKNKLELDRTKYRLIKNSDSIINSLYASLKDTVKVSLINRRLDSLLLNKYTRKEFFSILKVDKAHKNSFMTVEIRRKKDSVKIPTFKTAEELAKYNKQTFNDLKKGIKVNSNPISKDSLN